MSWRRARLVSIVLTLGEAGGDRRRQRAAGAVGVFGRDARRRERDHVAAGKEIIDAFAALPVTALDQHGRAARREQPLALTGDGGLVRCHGLVQKAAASGKFGVISEASGISF